MKEKKRKKLIHTSNLQNVIDKRLFQWKTRLLNSALTQPDFSPVQLALL